MTPIQDRIFLAALAQAGIPAPVAEYKFHPVRRWRFDFCWLEQKVYLEINGGIFILGRHSRGPALLKEWEKIAAATAMGFRPLFCQPSDCAKAATIDAIKAALDQTI
jgi:hypothetical protein